MQLDVPRRKTWCDTIEILMMQSRIRHEISSSASHSLRAAIVQDLDDEE